MVGISSKKLCCKFYRWWEFTQKLPEFIKDLGVLVKLPQRQSDLEMVIVEREKFVVCLALQEKSAFSFIVQ